MAGCCIPGCKNSTTKGFSLRSFPKDRERRRQWIAKIGIPNWQPKSTNSRICEAHFDKDMWEKDRCDGKRKLKCSAVPTIFTHSPVPRDFPGLSENNNSDNSIINMLIASLTDEGEVKIDHQYQLSSNDIEQFKIRHPEDLRTNAGEATDWKQQCEELTRRLMKSESECERLRGVIKKREDLFNKLIKKSYNCGKVLKERLKKLKKESQLNSKLSVQLRQVFNEDQLRTLANPTGSGQEWSDATIKRALRLRLACGTAGYQEILEQCIPLPSEEIVKEKMDTQQTGMNSN